MSNNGVANGVAMATSDTLDAIFPPVSCSPVMFKKFATFKFYLAINFKEVLES